MNLRPYRADDLDAVVELALPAWEPVFVEWQRLLGPDLYPVAICRDWRARQKNAVEGSCTNEKHAKWVAESDGTVAGFVAYEVRGSEGEIELVAVHPHFQQCGIGTALNSLAVARMRDAGVNLAVVGTGGDDGHAPARRAYEKAGFSPFPMTRYYKDLSAEPVETVLTDKVRELKSDDLDGVLDLTMTSWEEDFKRYRQILGPEIYRRVYPDWHETKMNEVRNVCTDHSHYTSLVVAENDRIVGFLAYGKHGAIDMFAVHPGKGDADIGLHLVNRALQQMKADGVRLAQLCTHGDPGHVPDSKVFADAGYTALPLVRYYQTL